MIWKQKYLNEVRNWLKECFEKDYNEAKTVLLEENYRSTKTILNAANNVIKNNKIRKEKNLWTQNEEGKKIIYYKAFDEKDESNYVVEETGTVTTTITKEEKPTRGRKQWLNISFCFRSRKGTTWLR